MGFFTRKSKWDYLLESVVSTVSSGLSRKASKVTLGVLGGAVAITAASAAVSAAREQEDQ